MRSFFLKIFGSSWPASRIAPLGTGLMAVLVTASIVNCSGTSVLGREIPDSCDLVNPHSNSSKVDAATFWTQPPEKKALDVLDARSQKAGITFSSTARENRSDLQLSLISWLSRSNGPLPDVYQVNGGSDVLQFALNAPLPTTEICALDSLDERYDFRSRFFKAAWQPAECQGSLYSIPLNIHRINTMLINREVYERYLALDTASEFDFPSDAHFESSESLIEFLEWAGAQHLKAADDNEVVPFSLGIGATSGTSWPITVVAFENLLASYGEGIYESVWQGGEHAISGNEMRRGVAKLAADMRRLAAVGNLADALTWQEATTMVADGRALLTISGDWIRAAVDEKLREHVVSVVFPGTVGSFVYTPDSFSVPRRTDTDGSSAHAWYRDVIDDKATQLRFSIEKQAFPALAGLTENDLDELGSDYLRSNYLEFEACQRPDSDCRLLLAVSGLGPAGAHDPCFDELGLLLGTVAGIEYPQEEWDQYDCDSPTPFSSEDAEQLLSDLLLKVSAQPYATQCRGSDSSVK